MRLAAIWLALAAALLCTAFCGATPVDIDNPHVKLVGRQIFVNNAPYNIRGVCYSPVPVGEHVMFEPKGDYFTSALACFSLAAK